MKKTILLALAGVLAVNSAVLYAAKKPAFYAGAGGGTTSIDTQGGNKFLEFNDDDAGFKVYGGMMLDKYWGLELSYYDFGNFSHSEGPIDVDIDDLYAIGLSLSPVIPVYKRLSLVGRLGIAYWDGNFKLSGLGVTETESEDDFDVLYGLGPRVTINKHFAVEGGWQRLILDGQNVDMFSLGVRVSTR